MGCNQPTCTRPAHTQTAAVVVLSKDTSINQQMMVIKVRRQFEDHAFRPSPRRCTPFDALMCLPR